MQYLKEQPNGKRVPVSQEQFNVDRHLPEYMQILSAAGVLIYRMVGAGTRPTQASYKYGGTKRQRQFWDSTVNYNPGRKLSQERNQGL